MRLRKPLTRTIYKSGNESLEITVSHSSWVDVLEDRGETVLIRVSENGLTLTTEVPRSELHL